MAGIQAWLEQVAATHRQAVAAGAAAGAGLDRQPPDRPSGAAERGIRELAQRLRVAAGRLAPGWLGAQLDAVPASAPLGSAGRPELVRIGTAYPLDDASFPVVVPLGHLAFDADARDERVAGALRAVLLRLLASTRAGSLLIRPVDPTDSVCQPFTALHDAGLLAAPVADRAGLQAVLAEAEQWVTTGGTPGRSLLLLIAAWPQETEPAEHARVAALASASPATRLHLLVAGWPPLALEVHRDQPPGEPADWGRLPQATQIAIRNPYVWVGHPPGNSFATEVPPGESASPGLNAPTYLDPAPPTDLINRVCDELANQAAGAARPAVSDLLPDDPLWTFDATSGLALTVGHAGRSPVPLRLTDATPHWLAIGRAGSGRTSLLQAVVYGLCSRYHPRQLAVYLLDFSGGGSFADLVPQSADRSYLPHARAVAVTAHRPDGLAVLRALARQLVGRQAGAPPWPRIACLIDQVDQLLAGDDPVAAEARELLATLARHGGPLGIHLVLTARELPPAPIADQCRVRIALPGGTAALDSANQAAAALPLGTAVVNTASGLGGPAGATRAHEQLVRLPDPGADRAFLAGLRHRLWAAGQLAETTGGAP